jgi:tRNA(adenine34) deaminase
MKYSENDVKFMKVALELAKLCDAQGDVPIGAVVVDGDGFLIGRGRNQRQELGDPLAHAEVLALQDAAKHIGSWRLDDCSLYVTIEPCVMCAGALINARIKRLVFGADERKTGAVGSVFDVIRDARTVHPIEVVSGLEAEASAKLLQDFFASYRD